jgi:hypothetical protein
MSRCRAGVIRDVLLIASAWGRWCVCLGAHVCAWVGVFWFAEIASLGFCRMATCTASLGAAAVADGLVGFG